MTLLLAAVLAATPSASTSPSTPPVSPTATARYLAAAATAADGAVPEKALHERVDEIAARFLGTPYVHSPLGEGEGKDPDPLLRFDAVDCLTYVEGVMALATARSPAEVPLRLQHIRYADGSPAYETRNHLMEAQWLPNNVQKGYLRPITRELGGNDAVSTSKVIAKDSWATQASKLLELPEDKQVTGTFTFELLPIDKVLEHARRAPAGTVMVIVREERARKITRITHLGLLTHKRGRPHLRHAASNHYRRVVDEDLETFLTRNAKYEKWPVAGFALYEIRAPSRPEGEGDGETLFAKAAEDVNVNVTATKSAPAAAVTP